VATFALLGATGTVGRLLAAHAAARGHDLHLLGRDGGRLEEVAAGIGPGDARTGVAATVVADVDGLADALSGADLVVSAVAADVDTVTAIRSAAVAAATPLVDLHADVAGVQRAVDELDAAARAVGVTVAPGVGWRTLPGDLLADVAATRVERPRAVHVAYVVPERGGVLGVATPGERRQYAAQLGAPALALDHGELVEELTGEARRLAWFPRPIGPHHAAGVPGLEPFTVPRHVPGVRTVRTYLAVSSLRAELLQGASNLARSERVRAALARRLTRPRPPAPARREAARWACVVEVAGEDDTLARGWMNGRDPARSTALAAVAVAEAVVAGRAATGVVPPGLVDVPSELLDAIAGVSAIRWSVARIDAGG
jgi:hypothetical protein